MSKILLIIPAYNEEKNILRVYESITNCKKKYDLIVINDCSKDNTKEICEKNNIPVINLVHNLGIGGAVQTGYKYALEHDYDIAVQFDGDGQHDINYVEKIVEPIINDEADLVIGSRFIEEKSNFKSTKLRRVGIKFISLMIRLFTGQKVYDTTSGFRAINKKMIKEFALNYPTEYPEPISTVTSIKQKARIKEIAVKMNERIGGISSIRTWKSIYYMINVTLSIFIVSIRRYK